jgi:hypothetical protein
MFKYLQLIKPMTSYNSLNKVFSFLYCLVQSHRKRVGGVAQVVACLPSKCEALSSNHRTAKTIERNTMKKYSYSMNS